MKTPTLFLFVLLIALVFCMNEVNAKSNRPNTNPIANADSLFLFEYSNDTISQRLQFRFLDDSKIEFKLTSENRVRNKTVVKQGIAINKYKDFGPSETDEDETGSLYPVVEYMYEKECWLAFRFDTKYMRLRIKEADNEEAVSCCPLKSVGGLRPAKINSGSVDTPSLARVFVDETTSEDGVVTCEYRLEDDYTVIYDRLYPNRDMREVYKNKVRNIEKYLRVELPGKSLTDKIDNDEMWVEITYTYKAKGHWEIELFYRGGVTTVELIQQGKDMRVIETYSAD